MNVERVLPCAVYRTQVLKKRNPSAPACARKIAFYTVNVLSVPLSLAPNPAHPSVQLGSSTVWIIVTPLSAYSSRCLLRTKFCLPPPPPPPSPSRNFTKKTFFAGDSQPHPALHIRHPSEVGRGHVDDSYPANSGGRSNRQIHYLEQHFHLHLFVKYHSLQQFRAVLPESYAMF